MNEAKVGGGCRYKAYTEECGCLNLKTKLLHAEVIAFHPGYEEKDHTHEYAEVVFVRGGRGWAWIDGREYPIGKGSILVYNAGVVHREKSDVGEDKALDLRVLAFGGIKIHDLPRNWLIPAHYEPVISSEDRYEVFDGYLSIMTEEMRKRDAFCSDVVLHLSQILLINLYRLFQAGGNGEHLISNGHIFRLALDYIDAHYKENLNLDSIASACFANKYYLSHLFSRMKGCSIGSYLQQKRFEEACRLLAETDLTIKDVAKEVGFNDAAYFGRAFRQKLGITPTQFRLERQDVREEASAEIG